MEMENGDGEWNCYRSPDRPLAVYEQSRVKIQAVPSRLSPLRQQWLSSLTGRWSTSKRSIWILRYSALAGVPSSCRITALAANLQAQHKNRIFSQLLNKDAKTYDRHNGVGATMQTCLGFPDSVRLSSINSRS